MNVFDEQENEWTSEKEEELAKPKNFGAAIEDNKACGYNIREVAEYIEEGNKIYLSGEEILELEFVSCNSDDKNEIKALITIEVVGGPMVDYAHDIFKFYVSLNTLLPCLPKLEKDLTDELTNLSSMKSKYEELQKIEAMNIETLGDILLNRVFNKHTFITADEYKEFITNPIKLPNLIKELSDNEAKLMRNKEMLLRLQEIIFITENKVVELDNIFLNNYLHLLNSEICQLFIGREVSLILILGFDCFTNDPFTTVDSLTID